MEEFKYGIETNGVIIAKFLHEHDRDVSQDTLAEEFEDCIFSPVDMD